MASPNKLTQTPSPLVRSPKVKSLFSTKVSPLTALVHCTNMNQDVVVRSVLPFLMVGDDEVTKRLVWEEIERQLEED